MYKLTITDLAQDDLDAIVEYIACQLENPIAAGAFLDEVEECYKQLNSNPLVYARSNDLRLAREGYRKAVIKKYLLMFKVDEDTKTVVVYRVFYGAMDYEKML